MSISHNVNAFECQTNQSVRITFEHLTVVFAPSQASLLLLLKDKRKLYLGNRKPDTGGWLLWLSNHPKQASNHINSKKEKMLGSLNPWLHKTWINQTIGSN